MFLHYINETQIHVSNVSGQINWINSVFCLNYCKECDCQLGLAWAVGLGNMLERKMHHKKANNRNLCKLYAALLLWLGKAIVASWHIYLLVHWSRKIIVSHWFRVSGVLFYILFFIHSYYLGMLACKLFTH